MRKILKAIKEAIYGTDADYTEIGINRAIFLLSVPMIIEMFGEGLFAIVDAYFVSQVSKDAFAAVMLTETVATLVYSLAIGISIAATAMVARRIGEKNPEGAARAAAQSILIALSFSVFISLIGIFFATDILRAMGATESVIEVGKPYTQILLGSNIVIMLLFILNGIFRGSGDATMAMRSLWIANIINIVLDPLLIFGIGPFPELGVMGAAVATTIGRSIGVAFQLYILFNGNRVIQLVKSYFKPNKSIIKKMLDIATTGTGQYLIASASWIFMMRLVSEFGTGAVNGYGLAVRIIIFTILPAWGIANAGATMMGQNLGAKRPDRAETAVWRASWYNALFLFLISIVFFIAADDLISVFNDDADVIRIGAQGLQIFAIGYIFFGFGMVINQAFGGAGDTRTPTLINFVSFWLVQIPLAYTLTKYLEWGVSGVFWAVVISEIILALFAVWIFRMGRWKTVKI